MRRFGEGSGVLSWGFRARAFCAGPRTWAWVCSGLAAVVLHGLAWQLAGGADPSTRVGLELASQRLSAVAITLIEPATRPEPPRPATDRAVAPPHAWTTGPGAVADAARTGAGTHPMGERAAPRAAAATAADRGALAETPEAPAPGGRATQPPPGQPEPSPASPTLPGPLFAAPDTQAGAPDEPLPARAPTADALAALPRYATDLPAAFRWPLVGTRNGAPVSGQWVFDRSAGSSGEARFESQLSLTQGGKPWLRWGSQGPVRSHGLQPERFEDSRRGRRAAAAMDHTLGEASFSGRQARAEISPLAQDRLSWMLQLIAAVRADPALQRPGAELRVQVLGAQGASMIWVVQGQGLVALSQTAQPQRTRPGAPAHPPEATPSANPAAPAAAQPRPTQALLFVREPESPYDSRVAVWLDPSDGMALLRLRVVQVPSGAVWDLWRPTLEAGASATM